jgi:hypothetical protein
MTHVRTAAKLPAIGEVLSFEPVPGVKVRLQRVMSAAFVVTVERTLLEHDLTRSYPTEDEARRYARGICRSLRKGMTVDMLVEILSATPAA